MASELLKVLILPAALTGTGIVTVLAARHGLAAIAHWSLVGGWLLASGGLTVVARQAQVWPIAGYLQNFAAFLGVCALPILAEHAVSAWLQARGTIAAAHLGLTLVFALLAIVPAALGGPYWAMLLSSRFGWQYITHP